MRPITRHAAAALGALALAGTTTLTAHADAAQPAPAGDEGGSHISGYCPSVANPTVPGGRAHWELVCADGGVNFFGWVEDTLPDNTDICVDTVDNWGLVRTKGFGTRESFNYRVANTNYVGLELSHC
ncbi:hypothetical protein [Prauserella alba]|uniref:Peptidase inhibitor family I36 n=1 Tax=Prauserella alba TaxID=176898 RepID=A0ABP4G0M6_9PSEU|nr:hypothetical protein [Prauserella alba]MCP2178993.1 hypothetical protein [Prauserella alba]